MENRNASIGLFVIGGLLLFAIGMFVIGDRHQVFARHTEYYSEFVNIAGLANGAKVRVAGKGEGPGRAPPGAGTPPPPVSVKSEGGATLRGPGGAGAFRYQIAE